MHPDRPTRALDIELAEIIEAEISRDELGCVIGDVSPAGLRERLHALGKADRVADRGVFDSQVVADCADDDLPRVDAHPHREAQPRGAAHFGRVGGELILQRQRRPARTLRMVLVGDRRTKQRHDPIAGELVHGPLETVNAVAEDREEVLHDPPPHLRVCLLGEIHRPHDVRKQHRDLLVLTVEVRTCTQDLLGQVTRGVGARLRHHHASSCGMEPIDRVCLRPRSSRGGSAVQRLPAGTTELLCARVLGTTLRASGRRGQGSPALATKAGALEILMTAARAIHDSPPP